MSLEYTVSIDFGNNEDFSTSSSAEVSVDMPLHLAVDFEIYPKLVQAVNEAQAEYDKAWAEWRSHLEDEWYAINPGRAFDFASAKKPSRITSQYTTPDPYWQKFSDGLDTLNRAKIALADYILRR